MVDGPTPGLIGLKDKTLFRGSPAAIYNRTESVIIGLGRCLGRVLGGIPGWAVGVVLIPIAEFS